MILKITDARGWVDWRTVERVQRLGWSSEVVDTLAPTREEAERLAEHANDALHATTLLPSDPLGEPGVLTQSMAATVDVTMSENTSAAVRLARYWGLETTIHQRCPEPLAELEPGQEPVEIEFPGEPPLLWLRITEMDGREHIEGHEVGSAYLMADTGKTVDSLL